MGFATYDFGDSRDRKKKCAEIFGHWWHTECQIDNFSNPNGANLGLGIILFLLVHTLNLRPYNFSFHDNIFEYQKNNISLICDLDYN